MPSEIVMLLNLLLMGLGIYAIVRLVKRQRRKTPTRKSEMDIVNDKLTNMSNELKALDERLKQERAERDY